MTTWQGEVLLFTAYYFIGFGLFLKFSSLHSAFGGPIRRQRVQLFLSELSKPIQQQRKGGKTLKRKR